MAAEDPDLDAEDIEALRASPDDVVGGRVLLLEMYQYAWSEFVLNKRPLVFNEAWQPVYRDAAGNCCPLGHFISDVRYMTVMQNMMPIGRLLKVRQDVADAFRGIPTSVLMDLQACHDGGDIALHPKQLRYWHVAMLLQRFAKKHELKLNTISGQAPGKEGES
jgi:hypothetical protein